MASAACSSEGSSTGGQRVRRSVKALIGLGLAFAMLTTPTTVFASTGATESRTKGPQLANSAATDSLVQFYRLPHSGEIWELSPWGERPLDWNEWSRLGFPAYVSLPQEYVKYHWSANIFAVTVLPAHQGRDTVLPERTLSHRITYDEWKSVGKPRPTVVPWVQDSSVHAWGNSPELFLHEPLGAYHKLTYEEWRAAGFPDPLRRADMGFFRLAWDTSGNIAFMCDISAGRGTVLSLSEWRAAGSPTPTSVSRTPNDSIWTDPAYPHIYYRGAINFTRLTLAQWQSLGSPTPTVDDLDYLRKCGEADWIPGRNDVH